MKFAKLKFAKFRDLGASRKFLPAKVSAFKVVLTINEYCHDNSLQINLNMTKALIICKGSQPNKTLFFPDETPLKFCTICKYLGIEFQQNGFFKVACKTRMEKSQNAIFLLDKAINYGGLVNNILFFSNIAPILLYGAPILGPSSTLTISYEPLTPVTVQNIESFFKAKILKVTLSLVKVKLLGQEKKVLKVYTTSLEDKAKLSKATSTTITFVTIQVFMSYSRLSKAFPASKQKKSLN